jgi:hypothetical protein
VLALPVPPWPAFCSLALAASFGACLSACGAQARGETSGPIASSAPAARADAGGAAAAAGDDRAKNLDSERILAPAAAASSSTATTDLRLPWSAGETWYLTSGPHSNNRAALDFAPPNLDPRTKKAYADPCSRKRGNAHWVRAAADGHFSAVLRKGCPCVQIQHADGTTTNYFHLRRSSVKRLGFKVGDPVRAGQALGHPSCEVGPKNCGATHPASGVHVHFYRTNADTAERLPANGVVLSGWKVKTVGRQREGVMTKGEDVRETRGKLVGWACSPTMAPCNGKRNDLESDNVPVPGKETAQALSLGGGAASKRRKR